MTVTKIKQRKSIFNSDNVTGACPEVMEALNAANSGIAASYGNDKWSSNLKSKFTFKEILVNPDCAKELAQLTGNETVPC